MPLPSVEQYSFIISEKQHPALSTLTDHEFLYREQNGLREYCFSIGTSAAVFKAVKNSKTYAVRCFLRGGLETFERYRQLVSFLGSRELPWKVNFEFLENEILAEGQYYPVVKMDWENGMPLHKFIDARLFDHAELGRLQVKLAALSRNLEENGIGHGDLKYNNILIEQQGADFALKLIDYDSMFIPAFRGRRNLETGSPGFQPLKRLSSHFSETIDRFSIWVMLATLEAIKLDARVWSDMEQGGHNNEHSLFSAGDFFNPEGSKIISRLKSYKNETLNFYLDKIILFSRTSDLNAVEKPTVYKTSFVPPAHEKFVPPAPPQPVQPEQPKRYQVEIKTIPSGKDVLVYGIKKGITPLRLSLLKKDFPHVEVLHEAQRIAVPVQEDLPVCEIDFSKKIKEPPPTERDEILEFGADKYTIQEGELTTINWKVKGPGKIHISNLGEVAERTGTKKVMVNHTTNYVLTIGSENRSFTINVSPRPKTPVQTTVVRQEPRPKETAPILPQKKPSPRTEINKGWIIAIVVVLGSGAFLVTNHLSKNTETHSQAASANTAAPAPLFTKSSVSAFLQGLYTAYNGRDLSAIMSNYAPSVQAYYDSKSLARDSLSKVIKDLFITPASYSCKPDLKTLIVDPQGQNCRVVVTIKEKLKNDKNSRTETYTTTIEYLLDPSYKIISEKNPG